MKAEADVAFEIDGLPEDAVSGRMAWSVVLRGRAAQIVEMSELLETGSLPLAPWQGGAKGRFIRVMGEVSGRRFHITGSGW